MFSGKTMNNILELRHKKSFSFYSVFSWEEGYAVTEAFVIWIHDLSQNVVSPLKLISDL